MKRFFSILASTVLAMTFCYAQGSSYSLYTVDASCEAGHEVTININMTNATAITLWQADLVLPTGVTLGHDEEDPDIPLISVASRTSYTKHQIAATTQPDGSTRILCSSATNKTFSGYSGTVATMTLYTDRTLTAGDLELQFKNILLVQPDATSFTPTATTSKLTITTNLVTGISVSGTSSLNIGGTSNLTATVTPSNATYPDVTWSSSNTAVATVTDAGVVTAVSAGTATITATAKDASGKSGSIDITVAAAPVNYTLVDGTTFSNPSAFFEENFVYTRTFGNTAWQSLYIPVSLSYSDWASDFEVAELYDVNVYDDDNDGTIDRTEIEFIRLAAGSHTDANVPYVIRAKSTGTKSITKHNCTVQPSVENTIDCSNTKMLFTITGTYTGKTGAEMYNNSYYALSNGNWMRAANNTVSLKAERAYLNVTDRVTGDVVILAPTIHMLIDGEYTDEFVDSSTSLEEVETIEEAPARVQMQNIGLRPGIYNINGRKIEVVR